MLGTLQTNEEIRDADEELLYAALAAPEGDLRAFEQLIGRHKQRILADCQYLTGDHNYSEDLAQEVFVKAFFGLRSFEGRSSFRHWLQTIKVHHCLNHIKKNQGKEALAIDEESAESLQQLQVPPAAERSLDAMEERERIGCILNTMPQSLRVPLIMRDMDEMSYEEVATSLGIGLSAVKMRIKRAREQFRRLYEGKTESAGKVEHESRR